MNEFLLRLTSTYRFSLDDRDEVYYYYVYYLIAAGFNKSVSIS